MWIVKDGKLVHTTDEERVEFRTTISSSMLENLKLKAEKYETHVNYLIESGLREALKQKVVDFDITNRPKDRQLYLTTYDAKLLEEFRDFALINGMYANDFIEYSVDYINYDKIKNKQYRNRIEEVEEDDE